MVLTSLRLHVSSLLRQKSRKKGSTAVAAGLGAFPSLEQLQGEDEILRGDSWGPAPAFPKAGRNKLLPTAVAIDSVSPAPRTPCLLEAASY